MAKQQTQIPNAGTDFASAMLEIQKYHEKYREEVIVIKFGGALAESDDRVRSIARQAAYLSHSVDADVVVVHGGGSQIDVALTKAGIKPRRDANELRITDNETLEITDQVLRHMNGRIVRLFQEVSDNVRAFGMAGYDGRIIQAEPINEYTGKPVGIDNDFFRNTLDFQGMDNIPVIYPVCWNDVSEDGERRLNVNADDVAAMVASKLKARRLILCSDIPGVKDKDGNILTGLSTDDVERLIDDGTVTGGMKPKLRAAAQAAMQLPTGGVVILDGRKENTILEELMSEKGSGTLIRSAERLRTLGLEHALR